MLRNLGNLGSDKETHPQREQKSYNFGQSEHGIEGDEENIDDRLDALYCI